MIKSQSQEELSNSINNSEFDFKNTASSSSAKYNKNDINPPSSPRTNTGPGFLRNPNPTEVLQLNEDSHTWKLTNSNSKKSTQNIHQSNKNLQFCFGKLQSYLKTENAFEFRFKIIVAFLFLTILLMVMLTRYFHYNLQIKQAIDDQIFLYDNSKKMTFLNDRGENLLNLHFGQHIPNDIRPINCRSISYQDKICYDWKYRAQLSVKLSRESFTNSFAMTEEVTCYQFLWRVKDFYGIKDCFDMSDAYWFGMGDIYALKMPLNKMSISELPFITSHNASTLLSGSIIGRNWFSSKGVLISVNPEVPLFVSINSQKDLNKLCFISKTKHPYYTNNIGNYFAHLDYSICLAQSVNTLQNYFFTKQNSNNQNNNDKDESLPSLQTEQSVQQQEPETENVFLDRIIWSTNINVLPNFTQQNVQSYVDQITNYGFGGIILLDSRWENSIGELKMNESVFNTPKALISILHNKGFKIMLTISPNVALRSEMVDNANDYILMDSYLRTPLLTRCSNNLDKFCALINFTSVDNRDHFRDILNKQLLNDSVGLSVDGLYFQSAQSTLLPRHINYEKNINPDQFGEHLNSVIRSLSTAVGISTSIDSKNFSGYAKLYPRNSSWNGLQSIIPSVLSLGLIGYPLVNTGVVGGSDLFTKIKNDTDYLNKELYLRWLQVVIFLPVVEFAEPPGGNDLDVIKVAKRLLKLRNEHFVPKMKSALIEFNQKGSPIVRPMWWGQNESEVFLIDDQFMVGNEIVVAPILEEGKTERDIYLPHGWWKDEILAQVIRGGKWMRKYQVPLDKIAFFIRTETPTPLQTKR